jgi:hypothetical protein
MEKEKNEQLFKAKEYYNLKHEYTIFFTVIAIIMGIVILAQYFRINSLNDTVMNRVFIKQDHQMYAAIPENQDKVDLKDVEAFASVVMYNGFGHDQYSYDDRMAIIKPLIYQKGYEYIEATYTSKISDLTMLELYKKHDARTYFKIDSVESFVSSGTFTCRVYGVQTAKFAQGDELQSDVNCEFKVERLEGKTDENPFGLYINLIKYINR